MFYVSTIPVERQDADGYTTGMEIESLVRDRLRQAIAMDRKGKSGNPRSLRQIAADAETDYNHLSKFTRGETWMDIRRLAPVCKTLDIEISWLFGGYLQSEAPKSKVHVIRSGRFPLDCPPEKIPQEIAVLSLDEYPNLSNDPLAYWVRLDENFGDYKQGGQILLTPSFPHDPGMEVAAVVNRKFVVGILQSLSGTPALQVESKIYEAHDFRVIAAIAVYQKITLQR
jgi:transcriptional regulator with XRE-family HTH domain